MTNHIDRECCEILVDRFYRTAGSGLGKGNGYEQTILVPRLEELESRVKDSYPEYYQAFLNVKESFLQGFKSFYSEGKTASAANRAAQGPVQAK